MNDVNKFLSSLLANDKRAASWFRLGKLLKKDHSPKLWENYASFICRHGYYASVAAPDVNKRGYSEWEGNLITQALKDGSTAFKEPPEYFVGKFNNRLNDACSKQLDYVDDSSKSLGFFGCSFTFGSGVNSNDIFIDQDLVNSFSNYLKSPVTAFNCSLVGTGIEVIADQFEAILKLRSFDCVVFLLPAASRVVALEPATNTVCDFNNAFRVNGPDRKTPQVAYKKVMVYPGAPTLAQQSRGNTVRQQQMADQYNDEEIAYRFTKSLNQITELCKQHNITAFFSSWHFITYALLASQFNDTKQLLPPFLFSGDIDDLAADGSHPGPKTHKLFADTVIQHLNTL